MRYFFLEWVNPFEIMMLNSLAQDHPVKQINRIMRRYKSINALLPGNALKKWHKRTHCAVKLSAIKPDDIAICNGYSVFPFLDYGCTASALAYKIASLKHTDERQPPLLRVLL